MRTGFRLLVLAGPPLPPIEITKPVTTFGKAAECDVRLSEPTVSRRHAVIERVDGDWYITDFESHNGTFLNGQKLRPREPIPLTHGDQVRIAPWVFRAAFRDSPFQLSHTTNDGNRSMLQTLAGTEGRERSQLRQLLAAAAAINGAATQAELCDQLLRAAVSMSGFQRAAVLRHDPSAETVEVLAHLDAKQHQAPFEYSRSLVRGAIAGSVVHLADPQASGSHSIVSLGISGALSAPLIVDGVVWGLFYLDSRGRERSGTGEGADACRVLAEIASLALSNLMRREVEARYDTLRRDAELASGAQRLLIPPESGVVAGVSYALRLVPGRFVSGDLVGVCQVDEYRAAAFIGDVTGKGMGAGLVMSVIQTFLAARLAISNDPAAVMNDLDIFMSTRLPPGRYASLWLGVLDVERATLAWTDAGHGLAFIASSDGVRQLECQGTWLGVHTGSPYRTATVPIRPGERLVLVSDGFIEQPNAAGAQFESSGILETLRDAGTAQEDVQKLFEAIERHAGTVLIRDDLTAAAFTLGSQRAGDPIRVGAECSMLG
ncbi:MAG: SpoIIE family protein phosphatase [Phycisphaerales bacterium]|nr:SpoIIE family protein phosphatase [Phycisphaerales bacterium]